MTVADKISELKKKKKISNAELAKRSGVPLSTLGKITSGITENPKLETLKAIAKVLDCDVEDFTYTDPSSKYYIDRQVSKMAQEIYDNPELRILFDASRKLEKDDILAVVDIVKRMKGYYE